MHKMALHHGLKSKSYGKDEDRYELLSRDLCEIILIVYYFRYLVISKHVSPAQLVQSLLNNGGSNDKYILSLPTG